MKWYSPYHERETRYPMCDECGHRMYRWKDKYGNWDGESYYCPNCSSDDEEEVISEHSCSLYPDSVDA